MNSIEEIWERVLGELREEISEVSYTTWIKPITPVSCDDTKFIVKVPAGINKNMIMTKYHSMLESIIESAAEKKFELSVIVEEASEGEKESSLSDPTMSSNVLNPKYTFSSFVVGNNNQVAYVASQAVAERPGRTYNPLFLYGGSGLGKTHLMQAIGNYFLENFPDKKILYTTSEKFTYELVSAIREKTNQDFRNKYRNVDLLLIDDVQFFANKETAQEEFFHTFNALYEMGKQIVLTSDRLPSEIPQLEVRLCSRFNSGLLADVQPPDFETRMAILQNKIQSEYLSFDDEIIEFIADNVKSNVRDLEGAVNRIRVYANIQRTANISIELVRDALRDIITTQPRRTITAEVVIAEVEKYYNLSKGSLVSKKRSNDIAFPRQIAMFICREILDDPSYPKIGASFGGRDHSTVMHNVEKIKNSVDENPDLDITVREIIKNIKKG